MFLSHAPSFLKNNGEHDEKCSMTGGKPVLLLSSKTERGEPGKLHASQSHLHPWKGGGTDHSGAQYQACKRKEGLWE